MAGWPPAKNAAFTWYFVIRDADGDPVAGGTALDVEFSIDGGVFADVAGAEVDEGQGFYSCPISAAEMNGDAIMLMCKTSTAGAKTAAQIIYTSTRQIDNLAFPTVSGRSLDVSAGGEAGLDWANIGSPTTAQALTGTTVDLIANAVDAAALAADAGTEIAAAVWDRDATLSQTQGTFGQAVGDPIADTNTIYKAVVTDATGATVGVDLVAVKAETASLQVDTDNIQTRLPGALVGGRMDSDVGAMQAGTVTAAAIGTGAIDADSIAAAAITAAKFAAGAIDAAALAADAVDEIWDELMAEPAQGIPAAAPALRTVLAYLYTALRNAITVTSSTKAFTNDAGTVTFKKALSDDGTTYTEAEAVAGP
jgi:hypothetical protein